MENDINNSYAFGDGKPLSQAENEKVCYDTIKYQYIVENSVIEKNGFEIPVEIKVQVYTFAALGRRYLRLANKRDEFLDISQCALVKRRGNQYYFEDNEVINEHKRLIPKPIKDDRDVYILPLSALFLSFYKKQPIKFMKMNITNPALSLEQNSPESIKVDSPTLCEEVTSTINVSIFSNISNSNCPALISNVEASVFCGHETPLTQFLEYKPSEICGLSEKKIYGFFDKRTLENPKLPPSKKNKLKL